MYLIRPIELRDLPGLQRLVESIRDGLTTLPNDPELLEAKIHESIRAFYPKLREPGGEHYLFVLEDTDSGTTLGTAGLIGRVGGFDPFYSYERRREPHRHLPLGIDAEIEVLHLKTNHKGPSEACSLFLHSDARRGGLGHLLSRCRFLFIAAFPERFARHIIAEMRGWLDEDGTSPFWESVARPFFQRDYSQADLLSGIGEKAFIADLMPRHPIYVPLLPAAAQQVIGRVHRDTAPALRLLEQEGFHNTEEVDIFDAGPLVAARCEQLLTVREAKQLRYDPAAPAPDAAAPLHLIGNLSLAFRAALGPLATQADDPAADPATYLEPAFAEALRLAPGDPFLATPLHRNPSTRPSHA